MPRQLPAVHQHAAVGVAVRRARSRPACAPRPSGPPAVSPKPPEISVTVRARRPSTSSMTTRSRALFGGHRHHRHVGGLGQSRRRSERPGSPRCVSARGCTAQMRSLRQPPPCARLRRITRPDVHGLGGGARCTTALLRREQMPKRSTGRAGGSGAGRWRRASPSSATRRPSLDATKGLTSSSARPRPPAGVNPA